ncbi:MAG: CotH kinase family protein [Fibrobacterales bacterium]
MHYLSLLIGIAFISSCTTIESYFSKKNLCPETQITPLNSQGDSDISFTHTRGFYKSSFDVALSTPIKGALFYSTNGVLPTPDNASPYTTPIRIRNSSVIRAAVYQDCKRLSDIVTHSYIFPEHVLEQTGDDIPSHAHWGRYGPDWDMDTRIINSDSLPKNKSDILLSNPTIAVTMHWDSLFGDNGIYISGEGVEQEASVEFIYPNKPSYRTRSSIEVFGGTSTRRWKVDKLSFKLTFRKKTGYKKLKYQLFKDTEVKKFKRIILDAAHNNTFFSAFEKERNRSLYIRDQYIADLQNELGSYAPHGFYAHLYLNGIYWGMYYIHERPDQHFAQSYLGRNDKKYNVIKHTVEDVVSGTNTSYKELWNRARKDLTLDANYEAVAKLLDIPDYINYLLINVYTGNIDWAYKNWYATQHKKGKWRFHSWDAEMAMRTLGFNGFRKIDTTEISFHKHLMFNKQYRTLFKKVVDKEFYNNGLFTPDRAGTLFEKRLNEIDYAIIAESARWGDNRRPEEPYTKWVEWQQNKDYLLKTWFPRRTKRVLRQIDRQFNEWSTANLTNQRKDTLSTDNKASP